MSQIDLFILTGEPSGDLQGAALIEALLKLKPDLNIAAVAGPRMRQLSIDCRFEMELLQVMGFLDIVAALPRLMRQFFAIRREILKLRPRTVVCIDYPGFHLRLERSLRKKGYKGKIVHYICPTVWAWGKGRIPQIEKTVDLLLTIFPFEKACFSKTFPVQYVGHPLTGAAPHRHETGKILGLFPGSRETEIQRNLPLQLKIAQRLSSLDPQLQIAVSISHPEREQQIRALCPSGLHFFPPKKMEA